MTQLKISLPPDLRSRLDRAAEVSGVSVAEEIRRRLWLSFVDGGGPERYRYAEEIFNMNEIWSNQ